MIKFRRGKTKRWRDTKLKLESGQPGYDKDKHKIKIGDGEKLWPDLPYASGLFADEILNSEAEAKERFNKDNEDKTIITYGTEAPNKDTVGQLYLQQYNDPEVDYIVSAGKKEMTNGFWIYQVYKSGIIKCCGSFKVKADLSDTLEGVGLYCDNNNFKYDYPKPFKKTPAETVTVQSSNGITWLANKGVNTTTTSGIYTIISPASANNVEYTISICVEGM